MLKTGDKVKIPSLRFPYNEVIYEIAHITQKTDDGELYYGCQLHGKRMYVTIDKLELVLC